jgi:hypothetical protein
MAKHEAPELDATAKTNFLKRTIARAVTPRAQERVQALRTLEDLLDGVVSRRPLGAQGYLLNSMCRAYPVSKRAIELELRGRGPQRLIEAAEQIELRLWVTPLHDRR